MNLLLVNNDDSNGNSNNNNKMMDHPQEKTLQYMLSCLSDEELELAAQTSYQYIKDTMTTESTVDRQNHAKAMARRYLDSKKDVEKALKCMKETLQFRRKMKLDRLVTLFDVADETLTSSSTADDQDNDDNGNDEYFRTALVSMLASKKNYVMGYDKQGRATFHFVPRKTKHHDPRWTLLESIYTMERALACSQQWQQRQQQEQEQQQLDHCNSQSDPPPPPNNIVVDPTVTINAVVDCVGFDAWNQGPPLDVAQTFLQTLRQHYVGNFYRIFILDAPLGFVWLWKILSPFVGTTTRDKIVFLTGVDEKETVLREYYSTSQAAPWMLAQGQKTRELDLDEYLFKTPFDHAFDDIEHKEEQH